MSKLARQLGLVDPTGAAASRVMRAMEFRCGRRRPQRCRSAPRTQTGADYDTEWARSKPARMARGDRRRPDAPPGRRSRIAGSPRCRPPARLEGRYLRCEPSQPPRHPLLLTSIPEPWRHKIVVGAAADYFFGTRITGAMSALGIGAIPIERAKTGRKSADLAAELIDDGWSLLIYPKVAVARRLGSAVPRWCRLSGARAGVPVVPVHVAGTGRILRKGRSLPRPSNTSVTFGRAITPADNENTTRFAARIERRSPPSPTRHHRLVLRSSASPPDRQPIAHRARGRAVASCLGAGRPQPSRPQPPETLAGDLDQAGW